MVKLLKANCFLKLYAQVKGLDELQLLELSVADAPDEDDPDPKTEKTRSGLGSSHLGQVNDSFVAPKR